MSIGLGALVLAAFWPALGAGFLGWDDEANFVENLAWRGLGVEHIRWMFTTFHMGPYQPVSWVTLGADHALFGMDAGALHRTSVLFQAATVVAFWFMARRLFVLVKPEWTEGRVLVCAAVAALVFGIHPLRVESVAWITERRDVVSGLFFVLATWAWLGFVRNQDCADGARHRSRAAATSVARRRAPVRPEPGTVRAWYWRAFLFFLLALLSKATVLMLPAMWLLLDVWPLGRWRTMRSRVVVEKLPFVALAIVFAVVAVMGQASTGTAMRSLESHGIDRRLAQTAYSAVFYPWKTLLPAGLSPIYDMPSPFVVSAPRFVTAGIVAAALCASAWFLRRRWPAWTLAWTAFLVLLLPVSGIVPTGPQLVADRYSYLACIPFALLAAGVVGLLLSTETGATAARARLVGVGVGVVIVVFGVLSWRQTEHWRTSRALWEHAYAIDPGSAVAADHLGNVRVAQSHDPALDVARRKRLLEEAITFYMQAYTTAPHPNQVFNMGGAMLEIAELDPATRAEEMQVALDTMRSGMQFARDTTGVLPRWRVMYAGALVENGLLDEARVELDAVLAAMPGDVPALMWLTRVDVEQGRAQAAVARLQRALAADPGNGRLQTALDTALRAVARSAEREQAPAPR